MLMFLIWAPAVMFTRRLPGIRRVAAGAAGARLDPARATWASPAFAATSANRGRPPNVDAAGELSGIGNLRWLPGAGYRLEVLHGFENLRGVAALGELGDGLVEILGGGGRRQQILDGAVCWQLFELAPALPHCLDHLALCGDHLGGGLHGTPNALALKSSGEGCQPGTTR